MEKAKKVLRKADWLYQGLSYLHCWQVCGRKEAGRRYREHQQEKRLREELRKANTLTPEERKRQEETVFPRPVKYSLTVPLYNTPETFLREMLASVTAQTWGQWELCLADGSDGEHPKVEAICREAAAKDGRIRYLRLAENGGISENTNRCLEMATGEYIALFDHDDLLHPAALYEVTKALNEQRERDGQEPDLIYSDETTFRLDPKDAYNPNFKPDYAPDTLRGNNYICHLTVFRRSLLEAAGGGLRKEYDGSQDYDLILRLTEKAERILHIPRVLYYWRAHGESVAESVGAKPYVIEAGKKAIAAHLSRLGLKGEVLDSRAPSFYRIRYAIEGNPKVSILIPNCDHREDLLRCVNSIREKTTWGNWEIIIIENNSREPETEACYGELRKDPRIRVIRREGSFNFSALNNLGAREATGEHLLLLNNDTEVISPDWLQEMLMYSQREDVGAVGAKLYYPDGTIQHAGLGIGLLHLAAHIHRHFPGDHPGYMGRLIYAQNLSAVTAACMMVRREVWEALDGMAEDFPVVFNDVDFCLRVRESGKLIVWTPWAELTHYESKSRGPDEETPEKAAFFKGETKRFQQKWNGFLEAGDPYYNINLTRDREDFSLR